MRTRCGPGVQFLCRAWGLIQDCKHGVLGYPTRLPAPSHKRKMEDHGSLPMAKEAPIPNSDNPRRSQPGRPRLRPGRQSAPQYRKSSAPRPEIGLNVRPRDSYRWKTGNKVRLMRTAPNIRLCCNKCDQQRQARREQGARVTSRLRSILIIRRVGDQVGLEVCPGDGHGRGAGGVGGDFVGFELQDQPVLGKVPARRIDHQIVQR